MMDATIKQAAANDREAMAKVVAEHYPAVFRFCARRVGPELAKDAAQETFLTAQRRIKDFDKAGNFASWLFGIAHNHCRNLARKHRFEISFEEALNPPDTSSEPGLIDRETLRAALLGLTKEHREVVVMHEIDGLTYEEAAEVLKVPVGTVKSRLHNAFVQLRRRLAPEGTKA